MLLFKGSLSISLCISCSYHFLFNSSVPVPISLPHFCFAFRVLLHLFLLSLTFSVHPFPSATSLFRLSVLHLRLSPRALIWPPGVQLLASVLATVFPLSYIYRWSRWRKSPHQHRTTFYFSFFLSRSPIHLYSSASMIVSRTVIVLSCLFCCERQCPISDVNWETIQHRRKTERKSD